MISLEQELEEAADRLEDCAHQAQLRLVSALEEMGVGPDDIDTAICRLEMMVEHFARAEFARIRDARLLYEEFMLTPEMIN